MYEIDVQGLKRFQTEACPEGEKHNVSMDQLGNPSDTGRSYEDPIYYLCIKCNSSFWPEYQ